MVAGPLLINKKQNNILRIALFVFVVIIFASGISGLTLT